MAERDAKNGEGGNVWRPWRLKQGTVDRSEWVKDNKRRVTDLNAGGCNEQIGNEYFNPT